MAEKFKGVRTTRDGRRVHLADFVVAFMPTGYMLAVAKRLGGGHRSEPIRLDELSAEPPRVSIQRP